MTSVLVLVVSSLGKQGSCRLSSRQELKRMQNKIENKKAFKRIFNQYQNYTAMSVINQPLHRSINMRYSQLVFFFLLAFTVGIIQGWHDESSKNGEVQQIRPHLPTHDIHDEFQPRPGKTLGGRKTLTKERGEQIEKEAHLNHKKITKRTAFHAPRKDAVAPRQTAD
ncbi:conserved hypothetical protein [Trichinella spiralis]|uniref:hypothetical protein n=1 Tax=Trichinella spiralis TaxID=6334 RepID=UPI0001EFCE90|nr:conserved hypothetical protein [Trichinella spiralis]